MGIWLRDRVFLHASKLLLIPSKGQVPRDDLENSPIFFQKNKLYAVAMTLVIKIKANEIFVFNLFDTNLIRHQGSFLRNSRDLTFKTYFITEVAMTEARG